MCEHDGYRRYDGDTEYDMWVDYAYYVNTDEPHDPFYDGPSPIYAPATPARRQTVGKPCSDPHKRLKSYRRRISSLQSGIEKDKKIIYDIDCNNQRSEPTPKLLKRYRIQKQQAEYRIEKSSKKLTKLQKKIPSLEAAVVHEDNMSITVVTVVLTCAIVFLFLTLLSI